MKIRNIICALAILLVAGLAATGAVQLWQNSREKPPVGLGIEDASEVVQRFCQALNDGDYETIDGMIYRYSSLNLTSEPEDESAAKLLECLKNSFECRTVGDLSVSGMKAGQTIEVDYFAMTLASADVKTITQFLYDQRLEQAQSNEELYDSQGNLLESVAMEIYSTAVEQVVNTHENYMVSSTVPLELVYENASWKIVLSEELAAVLLGSEK